MTTRLKLICHASTSAVRTAAFPADEPLDAQARKTLADVSHRLHDADRCLTSPALRASQTAEALKLDAAIDPALRDCDYGRWTGRSMDDVQAEEPDAIAEWLRDSGTAPHGGESLAALIERVGNWLAAQAVLSGTIVAVTHASVIRAAIVHAIDAEPRSFWRIDVAPLSVARLSGMQGRWNFVSLGALAAVSQET